MSSLHHINIVYQNRKAVSRSIAPIILLATTITIALGINYVRDISNDYMVFEKIQIDFGYSVLVKGENGGWEILLQIKNSGSNTAVLTRLTVNESPISLNEPADTTFADANPGTIVCSIPINGLGLSSGEIKIVKIWIDNDYASLSSNTMINIMLRSKSGVDFPKLIRLA